MSTSARKPTDAFRLVKRVLKVILFPFLFMVNPKIYLTDGEDEADERSSKG